MYTANMYKYLFIKGLCWLLIHYLLLLHTAKRVDAKSDLESKQKGAYFLPGCRNSARMSKGATSLEQTPTWALL